MCLEGDVVVILLLFFFQVGRCVCESLCVVLYTGLVWMGGGGEKFMYLFRSKT